MTAARAYDPLKAMLARVHIAKKELGLDDDTYRALIHRVTGKDSAGLCDQRELGRVLDEFKVKGWAPASPQGARRVHALPADHPAARKARALWISLHQLGVVRNGAEEALEAFAARQLGVERLQWADQGQCFRLIEALKAMAERAGWSQSLKTWEGARTLKERLVDAQWKILSDLGAVPAGSDAMLKRLHAKGIIPEVADLSFLGEDKLDKLPGGLARWIAAAKEKAEGPGGA